MTVPVAPSTVISCPLRMRVVAAGTQMTAGMPYSAGDGRSVGHHGAGDDTRRLEGHVGLAFLAYAAVKPAIQAGLREDSAGMRRFIAEQLRAAGADSIDPELAAIGLMALVDGLGMQLLSRQYAEKDAVAALDAQLATIFGAA